MALTTLSNWLIQNDESVDIYRQKTKNALLHLDTPHLFSQVLSQTISIFLYMGALVLKELTLLHTM